MLRRQKHLPKRNNSEKLFSFEAGNIAGFFLCLMKQLLTIFLSLCFILPMKADTPKKTEKVYPFNYGKMEDNVYTNPFFGIRLPVPDNWNVQNNSQIEYVISKGKDVVQFEDELLNESVKNIDINSMTLLMLSKYEMGAPVAFNPNITLMAEDVSMSTGIRKGSDYLFHVKNGLQKSNLQMTCTPEEDPVTISGQTFYRLTCERAESDIKLIYYTTISKRYAVSFVAACNTDEEEQELKSIINSITFSR